MYNLQKIVDYLTTTFDVTFGSITGTSATISGSVTANSFSGDGSSLTNLPSTSASNFTYRVTAGKAKTSGYPDFLSVKGSDTSVTLDASTTNTFTAIVNSISFSATSDM